MIYIIMGVSGCGKTTLGTFLATKLGWPLHEGDDYHPSENIEKMARGEPLTDQDRMPWLLKLHDIIERERDSGSDAIVVCSALKRIYRQILLYGSCALTSSSCLSEEVPPPAALIFPDTYFLFLYGSYDFIHQRMASRKDHFMRPDLLRSQFDILEPPSAEENALLLDVRKSLADIATDIEKYFLSVRSPSVL